MLPLLLLLLLMPILTTILLLRVSASFRGADAAEVCSNVGFVADDGAFECSAARAAKQIVSEIR